MSLKCERKTLHKYYSYRDKINVKKSIQYFNCQSGLVTNIHILDSGIALVNKRRFNFIESNMFCFCDSTILSCLV